MVLSPHLENEMVLSPSENKKVLCPWTFYFVLFQALLAPNIEGKRIRREISNVKGQTGIQFIG